MTTKKLAGLYRKMAEHTGPLCGGPTCFKNARPEEIPPNRCCSPEYCEMAIQWAEEIHGVKLDRTGHPTLPLMAVEPGKGCTAAPHLRPICTMHACCINSLGFHPDDPKWTDRYFRLRAQIERLETGEVQDSGDRAGWMYDRLEGA